MSAHQCLLFMSTLTLRDKEVRASQQIISPLYNTGHSSKNDTSTNKNPVQLREKLQHQHSRSHEHSHSIISDMEDGAEAIAEALTSPEKCKRGCHGWLCEAKRSPGIEIFLYIFFFISLIFLSLDVKGSTVIFYFSNLVEDIIVHEEFPAQDSHVRKDFTQVGEVAEFWSFIHGPFANAMFRSRENICEDENRNQHCYSTRASLFASDFVLLDIRFKQNRVKKYEVNSVKPNGLDSQMCRAPIWIKDLNIDAWNAIQEQGCYPEYAFGLEDKESPFNTTNNYVDSVSDCFQYKQRNFDWTTTGRIYPYPYGTGGYTCYLKSGSQHVRNATRWLQDLEESRWIDPGTRMVMIDFTVYSANIDTFLFFRVGAEQSPTGGLIPFHDSYAIELGDIVDAQTLITRCCLGLFICIFMMQEVSEMCVLGCKKYCRDVWNLLEVINLFLFAQYFCLLLAAELTLVHERTTQNFDIQSIGAIRTFADNTLAINVVISSLKVFKYIKVSKRMSLMLKTFYEARYSLFALLILVIIFLIGFAMAFYVAFGHRISGFRSFARSFNTLSASLLGDFKYLEELERVNWLLGPLLYFMYQVFVSFVLLSLLIAIIEDAFQSTQKELEENHEKDELVSAMKATGRNIWATVINGVRGSTQVISSRLRSASASGGSMRVNTRSMSSNFQGWFKRKSKLNASEEEAGENNNGGGSSGTKDNGSNELQNTGKKEKRRMTHTFLQAVIQAGKIEKEKKRAADRDRDRDRDRAAAETKHQSNTVAGYGATSGGGGDSSGDRGDRGDRGQIAAHNNKIIAMTREVTRETTRTNSKISALEEKMDMILASFDAMIKTQAQSMNKASVVSSLQPDANVDASQSLHLPTKKDHKKSRRKSRRSSSALPPGWKKYRDDASGKNYYYNEYTEDRSWEKPSSMGTLKE